MEQWFGKLVTNRTDLDGLYDIHLQWKYNTTPNLWNPDVIQQAILEQLGLELVSISEPIEILVVEHVK